MTHDSRQGARHGGRLLLSLLLAGGAALMLAGGALAASSPAPAAKTSLHIGWVQEADNLNPFIGIQGTDYLL